MRHTGGPGDVVVTRQWSDWAVQRRTTVDHTIVVRTWVEPHDPTPRARLSAIGLHRDVTAYGLAEIERYFVEMLRDIVAPHDHDGAAID